MIRIWTKRTKPPKRGRKIPIDSGSERGKDLWTLTSLTAATGRYDNDDKRTDLRIFASAFNSSFELLLGNARKSYNCLVATILTQF